MLRIIKPQKMSLTKEIAEQENHRTTADRMELHLWKEGSFMRAYDWSAFLACRPDLTMVLLLLPNDRIKRMHANERAKSWSVHRQPVFLPYSLAMRKISSRRVWRQALS